MTPAEKAREPMSKERLAHIRRRMGSIRKAGADEFDERITAVHAAELLAEVDRLRAEVERLGGDLKDERWKHAQTGARLDRVMAESDWAGFP
jgi:hypothetical protein